VIYDKRGIFVVRDWREESWVRAREGEIESAKHEGIRGFVRGERTVKGKVELGFSI
jgi:hypothetical protein